MRVSSSRNCRSDSGETSRYPGTQAQLHCYHSSARVAPNCRYRPTVARGPRRRRIAAGAIRRAAPLCPITARPPPAPSRESTLRRCRHERVRSPSYPLGARSARGNSQPRSPVGALCPPLRKTGPVDCFEAAPYRDSGGTGRAATARRTDFGHIRCCLAPTRHLRRALDIMGGLGSQRRSVALSPETVQDSNGCRV